MSKEQKMDKKKVLLRIFLVVIIGVFVLIYDLFGFGGNIRFYSKWLECGEKPVTTQESGFMNAYVPHYLEASTVSLVRLEGDYYCTALEAERAGYSASEHSYQYPNLKKAGERPLFYYKYEPREE